jgi:two-component system sensor histidine kinase KdpD
VLTFTMMFVVGVVISTLVSRLRQQEHNARAREADTRALLSLTRDVGQAASAAELARALCTHVVEAAGGSAVVLLPVASSLQPAGSVPEGLTLETNDLGVAQWTHEHQREAGRSTPTLSGARVLALPIGHGSGVLAWMPAGEDIDVQRRTLIDSFTRQAGLARDRLQFGEAARAASLKARTEELRSSLLSTVSHDLRTPLAVVTGAATTLRDDVELSEDNRRQLTETIVDEAERLERVVRNLLDMTRVQAGALAVRKEWVPVDELIGSARTRLSKALAGREFTLRVASDVPFIHVDPALFEQVLFNLLDNAAKYTPARSPLELDVTRRDESTRVAISDRGPGVPEDERERLFDKFYRGHTAQGAPGAGLGLAICRGIVEAHGGTLHVEGRAGGGATFVLTVPRDGEPPQIPAEEAS